MKDKLVHAENDRAPNDAPANADGQLPANAAIMVKSYDSDTENDKPVLLELGSAATTTTNSDIHTTTRYSEEYAMDMHMNNYSISVHPAYADTSSLNTLYSNPYMDTITLPQSALSSLSTSLITPAAAAGSINGQPSFTGHIPQTVYTWSTGAPVASIAVENDMGKVVAATDIVPAQMYMSYSPHPQEHIISKEVNHVWKDKVLQSEKGNTHGRQNPYY